MKYIIISLGNYGHILAEEFSALGHKVMGADLDGGRVDSIKDKIATAFVVNATDEQSLSVLPLNSVDMVIVAVSESFGALIRVVTTLEQKQVQHIYACAIDGVYKTMLEAFGLEKILTPGEDTARSLVQLLDFGTKMGTFRIDSEYHIAKFSVPEEFVDYFVDGLNPDEEFHLRLIGLKRSNTIKNCLGISSVGHKIANELPEDVRIRPDDVLVCYGKYDDFQKLWKAL